MPCVCGCVNVCIWYILYILYMNIHIGIYTVPCVTEAERMWDKPEAVGLLLHQAMIVEP